MASRAEYLQMMKRMDKDAMGEEKVAPALNMGLDSLMPNMGKGSLSNRELKMLERERDMSPMMKMLERDGMQMPMRKPFQDPNLKNLNIPEMSSEELMEMLSKTTGQPSDFTMQELEALKGSLSDKEIDMINSGASGRVSDFQKALKDRVAGASVASMGGAMTDKEFKLLEDAMGGSVTDEIREAISALMGMGFGMTDAIEALGDDMTMPETMTEGAMSDKEMGALSRLPKDMGDEGSVSDYERSLGKDRTYSDDMYKQINT